MSQRQKLNLWSNVGSCVCTFVDLFSVTKQCPLLPLHVSTTKITVELCISGINNNLPAVRVTIWLSIIVVFSSKWSNKGHMLSAQVSTFKHSNKLADRSSSHLHSRSCAKVDVFMSQYPAIEIYSTDSWSVYHRGFPQVQFSCTIIT